MRVFDAKMAIQTLAKGKERQQFSMLSETDKVLSRPRYVIPFGCPVMDFYALGIGGLAGGRTIQIDGPERAGKTSMGYHILAQVQAMGGMAALIETETAIDVKYPPVFGVRPENLILQQPRSVELMLAGLEELFEIARGYPVEMPKVGVLDTMAMTGTSAENAQGLVNRKKKFSKKEKKGKPDDKKAKEAGGEDEEELESSDAETSTSESMGDRPRVLSRASRVANAMQAELGFTWVVLNQHRMNIGVKFGSPITTPGGLALKFATSQRLRAYGEGTALKRGETILGKVNKWYVDKNKFTSLDGRATEKRFAPMWLMQNPLSGFNADGPTFEYGTRAGIVGLRDRKPEHLQAIVDELGWDYRKVGWDPRVVSRLSIHSGEVQDADLAAEA